jgi:hypothetical protein
MPSPTPTSESELVYPCTQPVVQASPQAAVDRAGAEGNGDTHTGKEAVVSRIPTGAGDLGLRQVCVGGCVISWGGQPIEAVTV